MKKLALAVALMSIVGAAQATTFQTTGGLYLDDLGTATNQTAQNFSGYNGQPVAYTGAQSSGYWGALGAKAGQWVSFTYLGNESGYVNKFLSVGDELLETDVIGATISIFVTSTGLLDFSFRDNKLPVNTVFANGQQQALPAGFVVMPGSNGFDYFLGFNDGASGDADYDDFVVGVSAVPVPAAGLLFGSAILGAGAFGRRKQSKGVSAV